MSPRIKIRGIRQVVPTGYLLGRISSGAGDAELLNLQSLRQFGVAASSDVQQAVSAIGFGFYAGALLLNNELLGTAVFNHDVLFEDGGDGSAVNALVPPASAAVFNMKVGLTTVGTIQISTSGVATIVWSGGSYVLTAGTPLSLYAPTPADATLASVSGIISGTKHT